MASKISADVKLRLPVEHPVLPDESTQENYLITSALPYVNNLPHLGNIIGSTLSADVFARYCRTRGRRTLYVCGTDEYGTPAELRAQQTGVTARQLCDRFTAEHEAIYDWFQIGFDKFGRTSTEKHTEIVQEWYLNMRKNNFLRTKATEQLFSVDEDRFLSDRFIEGTCPNTECNDPGARGDQCDACGRTYDSPLQLINPRSKMAPESKLILRETVHMYFQNDLVQPQLEAWIKATADANHWPANGIVNSRHEIVEKRLKEGLTPGPITRDLKWGVPVPKTGDEAEDRIMAGKVMYVWMDAPIGYVSITANYTDKWTDWWQNPKNVKLYQFMGKDNVWFHVCSWPSQIIADGRDWTKLHYISATEYFNYDGGKFSKSKNIGVFGDNAKATGVPASVWRYYLLSRRPENGDAEFSWEEFITINNVDLLSKFGNLVNRVLSFVLNRYDGRVPCESSDLSDLDPNSDSEKKFVSDVNSHLSQFISNMDSTKLRDGTNDFMQITACGNEWMQEGLKTNDPITTQRVILYAINLVYILSAVIHPFMPSTSDDLLAQLNAPACLLPEKFIFGLLPGHAIQMTDKPDLLFGRIPLPEQLARTGKDTRGKDIKVAVKRSQKEAEAAQAMEWRLKFGGEAAAEKIRQDAQAKLESLASQDERAIQKKADKERKIAERQREERIRKVQGLDARVPVAVSAVKSQGKVVAELKAAGKDIAEDVGKLNSLKADLDALVSELEAHCI